MVITLATLDQATEQEVFDHIVTHLRIQNKRSVQTHNIVTIKDVICLYRSPDGLKCAAGCLMTDDEYNLKFEGRPWLKLVENEGITDRHILLISRMQGIHDHYPIDEWEYKFEQVAETNKLNLTPK